jgi:hypothetical protein
MDILAYPLTFLIDRSNVSICKYIALLGVIFYVDFCIK